MLTPAFLFSTSPLMITTQYFLIPPWWLRFGTLAYILPSFCGFYLCKHKGSPGHIPQRLPLLNLLLTPAIGQQSGPCMEERQGDAIKASPHHSKGQQSEEQKPVTVIELEASKAARTPCSLVQSKHKHNTLMWGPHDPLRNLQGLWLSGDPAVGCNGVQMAGQGERREKDGGAEQTGKEG